jgi:predicted phosphodiesterase
MKFHVLSDLHVEFALFTPPPVDADVVVLAGDIGIGTDGLAWARETFPNRRIAFVPGNHESYGHDIEPLDQEMRAQARQLGITYLNNDVAVFHDQGVRIIGSTFWTDFQLFGSSKRQIAAAQKAAGLFLRDFGAIRHGIGYLTPAQTVDFHMTAKKFIAAELAKPFSGKTVAITHHCPAWASVHPKYQDDILSAAFASRCEDLVEKAHLWIHGHTHASVDTRIGNAPDRGRIICNPRGYPSGYLRGRPSRLATTFENREFDPGLVIAI